MATSYARIDDDYLTPTRAHYWRTSSHVSESRSHTPAVTGRRSPPSDHGWLADRRAQLDGSSPCVDARTRGGYGSPIVDRTPDYLPSDDHFTPRQGYSSPSTAFVRGRDESPRVPGYQQYMPTGRPLHDAHAPARPHLAHSHEYPPPPGVGQLGTMGQPYWSSTGFYTPRTSQMTPRPRTNTPSRFASPLVNLPATNVTNAQPVGDFSRSTNKVRSPSMVKDPRATFLPPAPHSERYRLCLALDLDETLVYARNGPVQVRPYAKELLHALGDMDVEVIVWTAGERDYAQSVIRQIDPAGVVQHCVYRHQKWWTGLPGYSKNLRSLGRNLSRCLLVDNTPDCLRDQPDHGLLVSDFEGRVAGDDCLRSLLRVVDAIVDRPYDSVPSVLANSPHIVRRTVPLDNGGTISTWTLQDDYLVAQSSYQEARFNRDSPPRASSARRRW